MHPVGEHAGHASPRGSGTPDDVDRMRGTADLRSEHIGVARMLSIIDHMAHRVGAGEGADADDLAHVIEFLRVFVDRCHHTKEEQLLFPALRAAGISSVEDTLVTLMAEHVRGREAVARIAEEAPAGPGLAESMTAYTSLLREHIRKEEHDCFDLADSELPATMKEQLAQGYDRIERDVVGGGVHERFHALLDELALKYPS